MDKYHVDIWLTTNHMFPIGPQPQFNHLPRHHVSPFFFREVQLDTKVHQLFRIAKGMRLIPHNIETQASFYTVQILKNKKASQEEDFNAPNFDLEKASRQARKKRDRMSQNVLAKAERDSFNRPDIFDYDLTIEGVFYYLLGKKYELYRGKYELRIHINWKQIFVQLNSNPDVVIPLEFIPEEGFDSLYRRSIQEHPEMHQNIRSITYRTGPDTEIHFLTQHSVYDTDEAAMFDGSDDKKVERVIKKTAQIVLQNSRYCLNWLKPDMWYDYFKIRKTC